MDKQQNECPACGAAVKQYKNGHNRSGSKKCRCGVCGRQYTPEARSHAYGEEERQQALKLLVSGMSGRAIGLQMGMSKANVYNWVKKGRGSADKPDD
ncbi:MAG: hypothetical protein LBC13_02435 [Clostridiales bacterium]|jgi:transposase-like protein|nr:hypothetical protein [Clostridiales bacterium]